MDVIEPCGFPLSDRAVRRAAMDYAEKVEMKRHSGWSAFLQSPERANGRLLLFTTRGAQPFHPFDYRADDILLFGRESAGVPDEVHDACDARLIIPLMPGARSFNVTVTAALALGEALRTTGGFPKPTAT